VLIATDAQETRDMIRILANLYKSRGEAVPVLTAADFRLDDDTSGIGALLDSVSNEHHRTLRAKGTAEHHLGYRGGVRPRQPCATPARDRGRTVAAVDCRWQPRGGRSGHAAGGHHPQQASGHNAFQVELATIVENSFNIHQDGPRLVFREEENPRAKLMACARNDKLFSDGSDQAQLAKEVRYVIGGSEEVAKTFRVIALPKSWQTDPWTSLDEAEQPERWDDRLPVLVLPEEPEKVDQTLGRWLKDHLQKRRNTIRFLLPRSGSTNAFLDRDLLILARAEMKAQEWSGQKPGIQKAAQRIRRHPARQPEEALRPVRRPAPLRSPEPAAIPVQCRAPEKARRANPRRHRGNADQRSLRSRRLRRPRARSGLGERTPRQAAARAAGATPCRSGLHSLAG
jgi:hypothetical protein